MNAPKKPGRWSSLAMRLRWAGIVVCAFLMVVLVVSVWFKASASTGGGLWVGVFSGELRMLGISDPGPKPAYMATAYVRVERNDVPYGWWGQYKEFGAPNREYPAGPPKSALPPGVRTTRWLLDLPLWVPLVCVAILTGVVGIGEVLAAERANRGRCPKCGYDRRGLTSTTTRCPECGTVPPSAIR